jgi:MFS family permease
VFAACSLAGGLATGAGMLAGARLGQGAGAAMMAPAGLSILTTSFNSGDDRNRALGVWGAISGLAAAAGVFLGGLLSQGPGWRWVLFVNLPSGTPAVRDQVSAPELTDRPPSARSDPQRQRGTRRGRPVITRTKEEA